MADYSLAKLENGKCQRLSLMGGKIRTSDEINKIHLKITLQIFSKIS